MKRNEGVHLHTVEKDLDHDETGSFECESSALAEEANELKLNFTIGRCVFFWLAHVDGKSKRIDGWLWENTGNSGDLPRKQPQEISCFRNKQKKVPSAISHMTESRGGEKKNTHQNNDNQPPIRLLDLERKRNQEDSHRIKSLEHLDKRDAQSKIGIVGQDERAGEKGADGEDGSHPLLPL